MKSIIDWGKNYFRNSFNSKSHYEIFFTLFGSILIIIALGSVVYNIALILLDWL